MSNVVCHILREKKEFLFGSLRAAKNRQTIKKKLQKYPQILCSHKLYTLAYK